MSYVVTAIPKNGGKVIAYDKVYDIGHYYARHTSEDHEVLRLLIGSPFRGIPRREYIDLLANKVEIDWVNEEWI